MLQLTKRSNRSQPQALTRSFAAVLTVGMGLTGANAIDLQLGSTPLSFHGFASQGFLASTDHNYLGKSKDGSFEFNEFGLNTSISPLPRTRITLQAFTFDVGDVGNYELLLDYASVEYTFSPYFGLRGGRVRRPGGIYNHIQDVDLARTSVLLPQGVYDARWRDFSASVDGGMAFGHIPLAKAGELSYEAYAGLGNMSMEGGVARIVQNGLVPNGGVLDSIDKPLFAGAQLWWNTPLDGLRAGASMGQVFDLAYNYTIPTLPQFRSQSDIPYQTYSLEYTWHNWTFQGEYFTYNVASRTTMGGIPTGNSRSRPEAWYVGPAYRFNKWFEAGLYYTEFYNDVRDRDGSNPAITAVKSDAFQKDLALSLRFDPKPWWIVKLEGHYIVGTALLHNDALNPATTRNDDGWWMLAIKTTLSF